MAFPLMQRAHSCLPSWSCLKEGAKRFSHRSPSFDYLRFWEKKGVDFIEEMKYPLPSGMPGHVAEKSPKLWDRVVRTEAEMRLKGLVPFVHAMPAASKVLTSLYEANEEKHDNFVSLRPKNNPLYMCSREQALDRVPQEMESGKRPWLLSMSYAFASSLQALESAFSWGFRNHFGNEQREEISESVDAYLRDCKVPKEERESFYEAAKKLVTKYCRLKRGNFIVMGVPKDKLSRWAYDSYPYNAPTGQDILRKIEGPKNSEEELLKRKQHFATLLICDETLDPHSGIVMVRANEKKDVEHFCRKDIKPARDIPVYRKLIGVDQDASEDLEEQKREQYSKEVEQLTEAFKTLDVKKLPSLNSAEDRFNPALDTPRTSIMM